MTTEEKVKTIEEAIIGLSEAASKFHAVWKAEKGAADNAVRAYMYRAETRTKQAQGLAMAAHDWLTAAGEAI